LIKTDSTERSTRH